MGKGFSVPRFPGQINIGDNSYIDDYGTLLITAERNGKTGSISIGDNVYANRFFFIDCIENVEIGNGTMIGPYVYITDGDHDYKGGKQIGENGMLSAPVSIGANVWIGAHAVILKGVKVGDNAVIAAGAVVTKDVEKGMVVKGVPAR